MRNVVTNENLVYKLIKYFDIRMITVLSIVTKNNMTTMFNCIDEYVWKQKCLREYDKNLNGSWFDLYSSLSVENSIKRKYMSLKGKYINVSNSCKCTRYCNNCFQPITDPNDMELKCPHCDETNLICDYDINHYRLDNVIGNRGSPISFCDTCKPMH